jgi:hypothetical protein
MVDTGGSFGLSLINGSHPGIRPPDNSQKILVGSGLGGELQGYHGKAILKLSEKLQTESNAIFVNSREFSKKGQDQDKFGSIGNDMFNKFVVIFDYVNARVLFQLHKPNYYSLNDRFNGN